MGRMDLIQRMDNLEKDHHFYVRTKNNNFEFQFWEEERKGSTVSK